MRAAFALRGLPHDAHALRRHHDLLHALVSEEMTKRLACPVGVNGAERRVAADQDRGVEAGGGSMPLGKLIDARIELGPGRTRQRAERRARALRRLAQRHAPAKAAAVAA